MSSCFLTSSLLAGVNTIDVYRGTTYRFRIRVSLGGVPYDLTGSTLYFTVKCSLEAKDVEIHKTSASGGGITVAADPRDAYADVLLTPEDTMLLSVGPHVYDAMLLTPGLERYVISGPGTVNVLPSVTWLPL